MIVSNTRNQKKNMEQILSYNPNDSMMQPVHELPADKSQTELSFLSRTPFLLETRVILLKSLILFCIKHIYCFPHCLQGKFLTSQCGMYLICLGLLELASTISGVPFSIIWLLCLHSLFLEHSSPLLLANALHSWFRHLLPEGLLPSA